MKSNVLHLGLMHATSGTAASLPHAGPDWASPAAAFGGYPGSICRQSPRRHFNDLDAQWLQWLHSGCSGCAVGTSRVPGPRSGGSSRGYRNPMVLQKPYGEPYGVVVAISLIATNAEPFEGEDAQS